MNKLELIVHLRKLGNREILPDNTSCGLCAELRLVDINLYYRLFDMVVEWPLFSGCSVYPVPSGNDEFNNWDIYDECDNHWEGDSQYIKNRLNLCLWLADELEKELDS